MIAIRTLTDTDLVMAEEIIRAAYKTTGAQQKTLRRNLQLQPDGWIIALLNGEPVGLVGATDYGSFAYVGLMSVLPQVQRQGVGRALIEYLLGWLDARGCPTVLLDATPEGAALYTQFGFVVDDQAAQWQRNTSEAVVPLSQPATRRVSVLRMQDMEELTAFDAHYFGAGRAAVFAALAREYEERAFIIRNVRGRISGYIFAQARSLGPWVAETPEDAETLLLSALQLPFEGSPMVNLATAHEQGNALLRHYGFVVLRNLPHMRRGEPALLRKRTMIYGQTSFALG